jgi:glucosamine 6-phosphate synthetase-like amidotransferase/phosphosugar isomerase protein
MPVVVIAPRDAVYDKVRSNIDEVKARGGCIIGVISEDDTELEQVVDGVAAVLMIVWGLVKGAARTVGIGGDHGTRRPN